MPGVGLASNSWLLDPEFGAPMYPGKRPASWALIPLTLFWPGRKWDEARPQSHPRPEAGAFFTLAFQSYPMELFKNQRFQVLAPGSWIKGNASAQV